MHSTLHCKNKQTNKQTNSIDQVLTKDANLGFARCVRIVGFSADSPNASIGAAPSCIHDVCTVTGCCAQNARLHCSATAYEAQLSLRSYALLLLYDFIFAKCAWQKKVILPHPWLMHFKRNHFAASSPAGLCLGDVVRQLNATKIEGGLPQFAEVMKTWFVEISRSVSLATPTAVLILSHRSSIIMTAIRLNNY